MTFLTGFHCCDGLVLCGESEESDEINKKNVDKLFVKQIQDAPGICFGGSGNAILIDKLRSKLFPLIAATRGSQDEVELYVEKAVESCITKYVRNTVDGFNIILGHVEKVSDTSHNTFLYQTYDNDYVLRPIEWGNFTCVGMDTSLAQFLLGAAFDPFMETNECLRLGVWITSVMRKATTRVSGPMIAYTYKRGSARWERHYARDLEKISENYPVSDIVALLEKYWQMKNPDIWTITDNSAFRSTSKRSASGK